jgi:hypothetical protein
MSRKNITNKSLISASNSDEQILESVTKKQNSKKKIEEIEIENDTSSDDKSIISNSDNKKDNKNNNMNTEKKLKFKLALTVLKTKIALSDELNKEIRHGIKKLELLYDQDICKAYKTKRIRKHTTNTDIGFIKKSPMSKELMELIGEDENTMMSIPEYTSKFFDMLEENNLLYQKDKRIFRANDKLIKLFGLPENVNESVDHRDKNGFNLYNLQTYISKVNDPDRYAIKQQAKKQKEAIIKNQKEACN